jgi:hypothetical protein
MSVNLEKLEKFAQEYGQEGCTEVTIGINEIANFVRKAKIINIKRRIEARRVLFSLLKSGLPENTSLTNR